MKYYILRDDWKSACLKDEKPLELYENYSFDFGVSIKEKLPVVKLVSKKIQLPDFIPNVHQILIVNKKILDILNFFDINLQSFPVEVYSKDKELLSNEYYSLNILNVIDAIDFENSELKRSDDEDDYIMDVLDLRLDKAKTDGHLFFRIKGCETLVVVREDLASAIVNKGCTGLTFVNAEGFRM